MISGIGFLTSFCFFVFLHTNMHHLYYREWEEKWTYMVLERWRRWRCCVLCFTVSSASVRFASVSPSSSFCSLFLLCPPLLCLFFCCLFPLCFCFLPLSLFLSPFVLFPPPATLCFLFFFFTFSPPLFSPCSFCPCSPLLFFFLLSGSPHCLIIIFFSPSLPLFPVYFVLPPSLFFRCRTSSGFYSQRMQPFSFAGTE